MKKIYKILIIVFLLLLLAYASNITMIPNNIILIEGEKLNINTILGVALQKNATDETMQTSSVIGTTVSDKIGKTDLSLNLFNTIPLKKVTVDVIPKTKVVPVGNIIGLKLYTKGILVVGLSETGTDSGIEEGDTILTVNEKKVSTTQDLIETVNEGLGEEVKITYDRNGEIKVANIIPSRIDEGTYRLGLWVRDAAAGVGTISYYEPSTNSFVALGHGVQDIDTEKLITISNGKIVTTSIVDIKKGESGMPRRN